MTLRTELINSINRFRTVSINHPVGFIWKNNVMTFYQLGKKWTMSKLFHSCYMPRKARGVILPDTIKRLLTTESAMTGYSEDLIIVPKELGFDLLKPNPEGDPILLDEIRFVSVKNKLVYFFMRFIPAFRPIVLTMNKEFNR